MVYTWCMYVGPAPEMSLTMAQCACLHELLTTYTSCSYTSELCCTTEAHSWIATGDVVKSSYYNTHYMQSFLDISTLNCQVKQSFWYSNLFLMTNCSSIQSITVWSLSVKYLLWNIGPVRLLTFTLLLTLQRSALVMMQMWWTMNPLLQYLSACASRCPVIQL